MRNICCAENNKIDPKAIIGYKKGFDLIYFDMNNKYNRTTINQQMLYFFHASNSHVCVYKNVSQI